MVRFIFTIIFAQILCLCAESQESNIDNGMLLEASFNVDTIFMEDSLKVHLLFKNTSNTVLDLYPEGIIGLVHNHKEFITYDTPQRITYKLHDFSNTKKVVSLNPGDEYQYDFDILANSNFFYEGENTVLVYYHFFDEPNKRKCKKREPKLSLWSTPINIIIRKQ